MEYGLGWRTPAGLKAEKGSVTHKALEMLARKKLALQRGEQDFRDDELERTFLADEVEPEMALDLAFDHYSDASRTTHTWTESDRADCHEWLQTVLTWDRGIYSPLNREVVAPEQYFDLEIRRPWARYDYTLNGERLQGFLRIKGTMDLLTRVGPGVLEYIDWKTGKRLDWKTGKVKEYDDLRNDPQFLLYHYAISQLYPGQHVLFTVFYVKDGGPHTIHFDQQDLPRTEAMLEDVFSEIRAYEKPELIWPSWKCKYLCEFAKRTWEGTDTPVCHHMRDQLLELGMDRVTAKYGSLDAISSYGSGGGSSNRDKETK